MKRVSKREEMRARKIVQAAMDQQKAAEIAEKRELIGQCFKYLNRYGDGERWWLYAIVTGIDEHARLAVAQFQRTANGQYELNEDTYGGILPQGGWQQIPREEFLSAAVQFSTMFLAAMTQVIR